MRVLIFGDSIAQGFYDSECGWADRIKKHFVKKIIVANDLSQPTVFNLGISGDTTKALLKRFENEIVARKWPGEEFTIIIATGTNDTIFRGEKDDVKPEEFTKLLDSLYEIASKYSNKIILVGLFPVVDSRLNPMPWSTTGKCYSTEHMKLFDKEIKEFCTNKNISHVDLFDEFDPDELTFDGIHPNDEGYELIVSKVLPKLETMIL